MRSSCSQTPTRTIIRENIFFKIESDINEANYSYWNMSTSNDGATNKKPTLTLVSGSSSNARVREESRELSQEVSDKFSIYPNPMVSGSLNLMLPSGFDADKAVLQIFNASGQKMYAGSLDQEMNGRAYRIEGIDLNTGYYMLTISDGHQTFNERLLVR